MQDDRFPAIEPYDSGMLDVGDGHQLYWECCGNLAGKPALYLHGGPGSGFSPGQRRFFDPDAYRVVLFDQRGSGRSRPLASTPDADLSANTTAHLIADIEALRQFHGVERWTILGMSWGTTLGLAYAQAHSRRVDALVLALVTTTSRREVEWITHDVGRIFPREWNGSPKPCPTNCDTCRWPTRTPRCCLTPIPQFAITRRASGALGKMRTSPSRPAISRIRASKILNIASGSRAWSRTTGGTPPSSRRINCSVMPRH
jgi:pimeloyl-ACP methyl ester carboxylesterase